VEEIKRCKYAVVLDALELLIVERIFELTKMNQSQTGRSAGIEKMWC
jgi:DNA-binding protein Fis